MGAGIGIRNLGIGQGSDSLQGALGGGIGIWNLGISSLQGALGAGIGIFLNLGISSLQGGGRDWNLEFGNFEFARSAGGRDWNLEFGNFELIARRGPGLEFGIWEIIFRVCKEPPIGGGWDEQG